MQALTLQRSGYRVRVICPAGDYGSGREVLDGVIIYRYPLPSWRSITGHLAEYGLALVMTFLLTLVVWWRDGFDVIHSANPPDLFFLIAKLYKPFGTRFVFDQHDVGPEICESRWRGWKQKLMKNLCLRAERASFRTADRVIANNESYRTIARTRGQVADDRITVVRNAPRMDRFRPVPPRPQLKGDVPFLVGYLGIIGPNDGLDLLIGAIAHLVHTRNRRDIRFVIIGSGDLYEQIVALSRALRLDSFVRFTGRIPDLELIEWLSTCEVCVAPDPKDPLNDISSFNKVVEYMALAKPIVAFDLQELRVTAKDAAVYVAANDEKAFGDAIARLLDAPEQRYRMSVAGRQRFETQLAWEHQEARLLTLYRDLLGPPS
jgi:glycosyltransferase involved in cell wall biosynthesis